ncbi:MAG TPA: DUF5056 domain-containing protein, partial [Cellvibrionaceae bacterium]|nr:DUF5056 domain-containing protein [Cellvibrionaceae bacterium]
MTEPTQHSFDTQLKQHLRNSTAYIADDGFSHALMNRLPARSVWPLRSLGLLIACLGLMLAVVFAGPVLLAPVFYWAAGLTAVGVIKIGL